MENLKNQQHDVEEIVAKERVKPLQWVHPRTVNEPVDANRLLVIIFS